MDRFDVVLAGGVVVNEEGSAGADVGLRDGKIAAMGDLGSADAAERVDLRGLTIMPGVIDTQVHFREPGLEAKEDLSTGSEAAVAGGVTAVLEMPNTQPTTTTPEALADKLSRAAGRMHCHYGFFFGASPENAETLAEAETLPGVPGIKMFMGSSTGSLLVSEDADVERVLRHGRYRVAVHSEDEPRNRERRRLYDLGQLPEASGEPHPRHHPIVRDRESARLSTERLLRLSAQTGRPVHVLHISTLDELPLLREAKRQGLGTSCEVTPQHLTMNEAWYERLGSRAQMNPPIRTERDRQALWAALEEGLFDVIGSDHAPHTAAEKAQAYPNVPSGMPGVQTMLPIMLNWVAQGKLSLPLLAKYLSAAPARLFGIVGKGRVEVGYDGDLAIVDPAARWTIQSSWLRSRCGWSPYEGLELTGRVVGTWVGGRRAYEEGELFSGRGAQLVFGER